MANTRNILAMIRSRAIGDDEQFFSIALQVAASEARMGHRRIAEDIRTAVAEARSTRPQKASVPVSFAKPRGNLDGLLELREARFRLQDVILSEGLKKKIDDLVKQQTRRDWLREHGKTPNKSALLVGPPGSGKTMSAEAIANRLKLPFFVIRLESLITKFMGETAAQLRLVFDEVESKRGVYLFDEFDALGSRRDSNNDVAEMRRVLNSFLQFMETSNTTDSLVIAATNFPNLLDNALLRRFDLVLKFSYPSDEQIRQIIKDNLRPLKYPRLGWKQIIKDAKDLSQSEIARAAEDAVKMAILDERDTLKTNDITNRLIERKEMKDAFTGV
ncbi:MAG: ATP-binding protein [Pseudomonadota bacterium]